MQRAQQSVDLSSSWHEHLHATVALGQDMQLWYILLQLRCIFVILCNSSMHAALHPALLAPLESHFHQATKQCQWHYCC
jgi:hypothetical protein